MIFCHVMSSDIHAVIGWLCACDWNVFQERTCAHQVVFCLSLLSIQAKVTEHVLTRKDSESAFKNLRCITFRSLKEQKTLRTWTQTLQLNSKLEGRSWWIKPFLTDGPNFENKTQILAFTNLLRVKLSWSCCSCLDAGLTGFMCVPHVCSVSRLSHKHKHEPEAAAEQLRSQFEP